MVRAIEKIPVTLDGKPKVKVAICACGELSREEIANMVERQANAPTPEFDNAELGRRILLGEAAASSEDDDEDLKNSLGPAVASVTMANDKAEDDGEKELDAMACLNRLI